MTVVTRFEGLTDLRTTVDEVCAETGLCPPRRVTVNTNPTRRASATAFRVGRLGSGFVVITQAMIDDLTDRELRVVVRHELSHYRHAEARWAPLQALAGLSPVLVIVYGWPLAHLVGEVATVVLYFLSLILHVLAFKSKRFLEARADRESVLDADDADAAQRALLKFGTLKERTELHLTGEAAEQAIDAFAQRVNEPETFSDRLFNKIWGLHPPLKDRIARYDDYVGA